MTPDRPVPPENSMPAENSVPPERGDAAASTTAAAQALLEVDGLTVRFGGLTAVEGLSFRVHEKQIAALIGPNGAGKTTAFNAISRLVKPVAGRIRMCGADLLQRHSSQLSGLGLTRTFQNLALWPGLTVLENVMVGAHHLGKQGFASASLRMGTAREERALRDESFEFLSRPASPMSRSSRARACRTEPSSASSWRARSPGGRSFSCWTSRPLD